jgi:hypothetical protein
MAQDQSKHSFVFDPKASLKALAKFGPKYLHFALDKIEWNKDKC